MEPKATASMLTRPDERRVRLRHHLLPSLAVLVVVGGLVLLATLLFFLVFLVDDGAELRLGDVVTSVGGLLGAIIGATAAVALVGVLLDRATLRARCSSACRPPWSCPCWERRWSPPGSTSASW